MRAPQFWQNPPERPGLWSLLLSPIGAMYAHVTVKRVARPAACKPDIPVICVGNLNAGGTGKTPTVIAVVQYLQSKGLTPAVISRGYGGKLEGPVEINTKAHTYLDVGDEPLLIAAFTRVWIGKDRAAAAKSAAASSADVIVMDDGFQNPSVAHDISLITVDAIQGFGNGRCIPAGPLREPVTAGLKRADLLLSIGAPDAQKHFGRTWGKYVETPSLVGRLTPLPTGMDWAGSRCLAFAGIGYPEKFFTTLRSLGADIVRAEALEDHQPLSLSLMNRLETEAKRLGAELVTTEKDAVRLPTEFRQKVVTLPVRLEIEDWSVFDVELSKLGLN